MHWGRAFAESCVDALVDAYSSFDKLKVLDERVS